MKKLLSLVLALVLILSLTAILAANAADNTAKVSLYDIEGKLVTTKTYQVGETFEVTVYLDTSAIGTIGSLKAEQDYTAEVLKLADKYSESSGSISDTAAMFPVTKSSTIANGKNEGKISYNASTPDFDPDAFDFCSPDAKLIVSHYTVIAAGTAEITNIFTTLAYADYYLTRVIDKGVIVDDRFTMRYTLSEPEYVPTEPSTAAPTNPPTVKPTTAPTTPPTVKPTTAPTTPPTVKPTTAPTTPPTVRPTTAPTTPPTVRPTTAPTTPPTVKPTTPPTTPPTTAPVSFILGDVNSDSKVDMLDPTYILRYCAGINTGLSADSIKHGDIDGDGVKIMDATLIQQYLAEINTGYPIGTTVTR